LRIYYSQAGKGVGGMKGALVYESEHRELMALEERFYAFDIFVLN
jgi:hypothetical protein